MTGIAATIHCGRKGIAAWRVPRCWSRTGGPHGVAPFFGQTWWEVSNTTIFSTMSFLLAGLYFSKTLRQSQAVGFQLVGNGRSNRFHHFWRFDKGKMALSTHWGHWGPAKMMMNHEMLGLFPLSFQTNSTNLQKRPSSWLKSLQLATEHPLGAFMKQPLMVSVQVKQCLWKCLIIDGSVIVYSYKFINQIKMGMLWYVIVYHHIR